MNRTIRAAVVALLIGVVLVGGVTWFMGFPVANSLVVGLVAGLLFAGLLLAADRRSASMAHPDEDVHRDRHDQA